MATLNQAQHSTHRVRTLCLLALAFITASVVAISFLTSQNLRYAFFPEDPDNSVPKYKMKVAPIEVMSRIVNWDMSPLPTRRSTILPHGARVACWPSTGGIWIKQVPPVELTYMSLSHTNDTLRPDPPMMLFYPQPGGRDPDPLFDSQSHPPEPIPDISEEDLFCQLLRTVGGDFWGLPPVHELRGTPIEYFLAPKYRNELAFWWERWGTATSLVNLTEARSRLGDVEFARYFKQYNDADSMEGRYETVQKLGAVDCSFFNAKNPPGAASCHKMWCTQYPEQCEEVYWESGLFQGYYSSWGGYNWYGRAGSEKGTMAGPDAPWKTRTVTKIPSSTHAL
jgi:hypothetical protein